MWLDEIRIIYTELQNLYIYIYIYIFWDVILLYIL